MRHFFVVLSSLCLLTGCDGLLDRLTGASDSREGLDRLEADIIVGRVEVMQDQTQTGLALLGVRLLETDALPVRDSLARLREAVTRYSALREAACGSTASAGGFCVPSYLPRWYEEPLTGPVSATKLRYMAEDIQGRMIPLWDAVCLRARSKSGGSDICAIE